MATEGDPTDFVKVLHLLVISFTWGMQVWVSFIAGFVLISQVSMHTFGLVQSKLFPFYFYCLLGSNAVNLAIYAWFGPSVTENMLVMQEIEKEHGLGNQVGMSSNKEGYAKLREQDPKYKEHRTAFYRYHGLSSLCNLIGFFSTTIRELRNSCAHTHTQTHTQSQTPTEFVTYAFPREEVPVVFTGARDKASSIRVKIPNKCSRVLETIGAVGSHSLCCNISTSGEEWCLERSARLLMGLRALFLGPDPLHQAREGLIDQLDGGGALFPFPRMASVTDSRLQPSQKDAADQNFDYMFKLLIIGNSSVGKTSFLFRYADNSFTSAFVSTVGIDFKVKTVFRNNKRIKLQIWDTAGQERYRTITTAYYRGAMGFLLMYDITNQDSFNAVQDWATQIKTYSWDNAQVILVANKCDLEDDRLVPTEDGQRLAHELDNINVKQVFECLVDVICEKMNESMDGDGLVSNHKDSSLQDTSSEGHSSCAC
ncbi:Ras-related protein Rab-3D [Labeo rohita]|uniref:small monomeric GTPase n=1 Tax=Labeo rohita TaxID=84645 RepID=A0ABQ8MSY5_LABRO|nr:Ras-related protein Rab-3D [Labeo rohita]